MSHWTEEQLRQPGKSRVGMIANELGRPVGEIIAKQKAVRHRAFNAGNWGQTELGMLGRYPDAEIARLTGRSIGEVARKREELGRKHP